MAVDTLLKGLSQARTLSELDHLLDNTNLRGIFNLWIFDCREKNYSGKTLESYQQKVSEFLTFLGDITRPEEVTPNHIRFFLIKKQEGHKAWTVHGYYAAIHRFFSFMVDEKIIPISPMAGMKPPKIPKEIIQPYNKSQLKLMLDNCDDTKFLGARNKAMILLYVSTGLRKLEMCNIELKHVDVLNRTIKVMGKGSKERIVRFGTQARNALMKYALLRKQRDYNSLPWLWLSEEGTRLGYSGISLAVYDLRVRLGIDVKSSTHALRHSFATQSLRNGASLKYVQELMGHTTPNMTLKYAKTVDSEDAIKEHPNFDPVDKWGL